MRGSEALCASSNSGSDRDDGGSKAGWLRKSEHMRGGMWGEGGREEAEALWGRKGDKWGKEGLVMEW